MTGPPKSVILAALLALAAAPGASAQQAVRLPMEAGGPPPALAATFFAASGQLPAPAVAIFHGCGGVGVNLTRMAQRLAGQGIAALLVDSFGARGIKDACTRNWPGQAQAEDRTRDIDAAIAWLKGQRRIAAGRIAVMGYSYGGGVVLMRALRPGRELDVRAVIAVYPDCALLVPQRDALVARQPILMAMAELDDWTPARDCEALLARVARGRERIESRIHAGAHHSFDAMGLPVRYLATAGNSGKPNNCCGAHYGYHAPSHAQFLKDLDAFLARHLRQ